MRRREASPTPTPTPTATATPTPAPGTGTVAFMDVVGTWYSTSGQALPRTHELVTPLTLPALDPALDPSSDFSMSPTPNGCRIRRFALAPLADASAGEIAFTGYNTSTVSALIGGTSSWLTTTPIDCALEGSAPQSYACRYATTPSNGSVLTQDVFFPMMPTRVVLTADHSTTVQPIPGGFPWPTSNCRLYYVANPSDMSGTTQIELCEQLPTLPTEQLSATIAGSSAYGSATATLGTSSSGFPVPLSITSVKSGSTEIAGTDSYTNEKSLSMPDASIADGQPPTITFTCTTTTAGIGCGGNLAALRIQTSAAPKTQFSSSPLLAEGDCLEPIVATSAASYTMTVSSAQMAALLAGSASGSVRLDLVRLDWTTKNAGTHPVLISAGAGSFGYTNR